MECWWIAVMIVDGFRSWREWIFPGDGSSIAEFLEGCKGFFCGWGSRLGLHCMGREGVCSLRVAWGKGVCSLRIAWGKGYARFASHGGKGDARFASHGKKGGWWHRLRGEARFRSAPSRSRASPYKKMQEGICLRASTTQIPSCIFLHRSLQCRTLFPK